MKTSLENTIKINVLWKERFERAAKKNFPRKYQKVIDFVYVLLMYQQFAPKYGYKNCKGIPVVEISKKHIYNYFKSCLMIQKISKFLTDNNFVIKDNSWISKEFAYKKSNIHANYWHITAADHNPFDKLVSLNFAKNHIVEDAVDYLLSSSHINIDGIDHDVIHGDKIVELFNKGELSIIDLLTAKFHAEKFLENIEKGKDSYTVDYREYNAVATCPKKLRSILFGLEEVYDIPAATLPTTLLANQIDGDTSNKQLVKQTLSREIDAYEEVYKNTSSWKNFRKWDKSHRNQIKGSFSCVVHCNEDQLKEFTTQTLVNPATATKKEILEHETRWLNKEVVNSINVTFPAFAKILSRFVKKQDAGKELFLYHTRGEKYFMDKVFQKIESKGIDTSYKTLNVVRVHDAIWCKPELKKIVLDSIKETIEAL